MRHKLVAPALALAVLLPGTAQAQRGRIELTPFVGYVFGGAYELDVGRLEVQPDIGYGGTISFNLGRGGFLDFTYLRQDSEIDFDSPLAPPDTDIDLSTNYFFLGGHHEFGDYQSPFRPFIGGTLGMVVFDPTVNGQDAENREEFALGANGGFKMWFGAEQRFGLRTELRGMWSWIPSDDYGYWCDFYGCFVVQGTNTVAQGMVNGGLMIKF
jgi:hypothetical protein